MEPVVENKEDGKVLIDGREIVGWVAKELCVTCGKARIYYDFYDAFFCAHCNVWLESRCDDPTCEYCCKRPIDPIS